MKFSFELNTDNAAFSDHPVREIHRVFTRIQQQLAHQQTIGVESLGGIIRDSNGNTVGKWSWE